MKTTSEQLPRSTSKNSNRKRRSPFLAAALFCVLQPAVSFSPSSFPRTTSPAAPSLSTQQTRNNVATTIYRSPFDTDEGAEDNYLRRLDEEKYAMQKMGNIQSPFNLSSPSTAPIVSTKKAKISYTDAGTLCIEFKAAGLDSTSLFGGAFSLAWFSAVVPATFASAGAALFMLPFWAAGGMVAKTTLVDPLLSTSLSIGTYAWSVETTIPGGKRWKERSGATAELMDATVQVALTQNGSPMQYYLQLDDDCVIGAGLAEAELQRLADAINDHLRQLRKQNSF